MRKVRQDGGIHYHVNVLQAMVSSLSVKRTPGKHVTVPSAENMQRIQSAGKHVTCASGGKMRSSSSHDWLGKINRLARARCT